MLRRRFAMYDRRTEEKKNKKRMNRANSSRDAVHRRRVAGQNIIIIIYTRKRREKDNIILQSVYMLCYNILVRFSNIILSVSHIFFYYFPLVLSP